MPTCEEQGYTLNKCTRCNSEEKSNYISATGHFYNNSNICSICGYVDSNISVIGIYSDKISIKKYIKDNNLTLNISPTDGYELPNLTMYLASYGENNELIHLETGNKLFFGDKSISFSVKLPTSQNYKVMLWTDRLQPLINVIYE